MFNVHYVFEKLFCKVVFWFGIGYEINFYLLVFLKKDVFDYGLYGRRFSYSDLV